MNLTHVKTVGIIGAGVAGLTTAKTLSSQGIHCTLFERNTILGGVWADGYSNFGIQLQKELYEFPDFPLPPDLRRLLASLQAAVEGGLTAQHPGLEGRLEKDRSWKADEALALLSKEADQALNPLRPLL